MSSRLLALRRACAVAALPFALPFAAAAATVACAGSPPAAFELSIGSGVLRGGEESRIQVQAHADGCVAVHRPWFLRDAGDYVLRLDAQEWSALRAAVAPEQLDKVDARRLSLQTGTVWKDAPTSTPAVVYADPDADLVTLQWREGESTYRLTARDPEPAAQRQPQADEVNRIAAAVSALRALARRAGTRVGTEDAP